MTPDTFPDWCADIRRVWWWQAERYMAAGYTMNRYGATWHPLSWIDEIAYRIRPLVVRGLRHDRMCDERDRIVAERKRERFAGGR